MHEPARGIEGRSRPIEPRCALRHHRAVRHGAPPPPVLAAQLGEARGQPQKELGVRAGGARAGAGRGRARERAGLPGGARRGWTRRASRQESLGARRGDVVARAARASLRRTSPCCPRGTSSRARSSRPTRRCGTRSRAAGISRTCWRGVRTEGSKIIHAYCEWVLWPPGGDPRAIAVFLTKLLLCTCGWYPRWVSRRARRPRKAAAPSLPREHASRCAEEPDQVVLVRGANRRHAPFL